MPSAAAVAHANANTVANSFALYLNSLDLTANRLAPIESIRVTEEGPGAVSSMSFTIEDPTGVIGLPAAASIISLWDLVLGYPIFAGYLGDYTASVFGVGRLFEVNAVGFEILLDWPVFPSTQLYAFDAFGTKVNASDANPVVTPLAIANLANYEAVALGLRAPDPAGVGGTTNGSQALPIGRLAASPRNVSAGAFVGPGTFRDLVAQAIRSAQQGSLPGGGAQVDAVFTVDFFRGLRIFTGGSAPDDYTGLTINDATAGPLVAASLRYEVHPAEVIRRAYVVGANAAGSGYVSDGTGIFGQEAIVTAPASDTAARLAQFGALYLASQSALVRGTLVLEDYVPTVGTIHPTSTITITDPQVSLAAVPYQIATITKTFPGGANQNWEIAFGGRRPSYVEQQARDTAIDWKYATALAGGVRS